MADYGINIGVNVQSGNLTRLTQQLKELRAIEKDLARIQESGSSTQKKVADARRAAKDEINANKKAALEAARSFSEFTGVITKGSSALKEQSAQFRAYRENVKFGKGEWITFTQAIAKTDFSAALSGLKRFNTEAQTVANTFALMAKPGAGGPAFGAFSSLQDLLSFKPANTTNALLAYTNVLENTIAIVDRGSAEYKELALRIKAVNNELLKTPVPTANQYGAPIGPQRAPGMLSRLGAKADFGSAISSGLIGGGFPLLFGQGGGAAAGGAAGGLAGGLLGGGFGFALSIVGTAIGDVIDKADRLDKQLLALNSSVKNTGSATQTTATSVRGLASALSIETDEVLDLLSAYKQFKDGKIREALVGVFTGVGDASTFEAIASAAVNQQKALQAVVSLRKVIGNEAAKTLLLDLKVNGAIGTQKKLLALVTEESIKSRVAVASQVNFWDEVRGRLAQAVVLAAQLTQYLQSFQIGGIKIPGLDKIVARLKDISPEKLAKDRGKSVEDKLKADLKRIQDALNQETELVKLEDQLTRSMKDSGKERKSQLAQLQNAYVLLVEQATVQKDLYKAELRGNEITGIRLNQTLKLLDIRKQENDVALEDIPTQEKAVKLQGLQVEKYRIRLEAAYQIAAVEQRINDTRDQALAGSNERINRLAAEIQGRERDYELNLRIQELEKAGVENAADQANAEFRLLDIKNQQIEAQQQLNSLVNQLGTSTTKVFEDLIFATDSWRQSLASALQTMASALFRFGLNTLADAGDPAGQGVGLFSILTGRFGKRANGGPVSAGSPYLVGERGPELFMPKASGTVIPNNALGMGGSSIVVNVDATGSSVQGNGDDSKRLGEAIGVAIRQELIKQKRPGGLLA